MFNTVISHSLIAFFPEFADQITMCLIVFTDLFGQLNNSVIFFFSYSFLGGG